MRNRRLDWPSVSIFSCVARVERAVTSLLDVLNGEHAVLVVVVCEVLARA